MSTSGGIGRVPRAVPAVANPFQFQPLLDRQQGLEGLAVFLQQTDGVDETGCLPGGVAGALPLQEIEPEALLFLGELEGVDEVTRLQPAGGSGEHALLDELAGSRQKQALVLRQNPVALRGVRAQGTAKSLPPLSWRQHPFLDMPSYGLHFPFKGSAQIPQADFLALRQVERVSHPLAETLRVESLPALLSRLWKGRHGNGEHQKCNQYACHSPEPGSPLYSRPPFRPESGRPAAGPLMAVPSMNIRRRGRT